MELQARAAYTSVCVTYDEDVHQSKIKSLEDDEPMQYHWTMVYLKIASVVSDESSNSRQEIWGIQASDRHEIGVYCSRNEWKHVHQSCEHAKECGWLTFMAQMAQDEHDCRHLHIAEQTATDHFVRELSDPDYWRNIGYQERNNNLLLA